MDKFEIEKIAVKRFLQNNNIDIDNFIFEKKDEPCDVFCKELNQEFQITWAEADFQKEIRVKKFFSKSRNKEQLIQDYVLKPINNKLKYGEAAEGIILLINSAKTSPFDENDFKNIKKMITNITNCYFKEIYLVEPNKNTKLFDLEKNNQQHTTLIK